MYQRELEMTIIRFIHMQNGVEVFKVLQLYCWNFPFYGLRHPNFICFLLCGMTKW